MDSKRQALVKLFAELLVLVVHQLGNFREHFQVLRHVVLLDHAQDLVLQQSLTIDVQRKILRIDDTLDNIQPLWNELITVIQNGNRDVGLVVELVRLSS